MKTFSFYALIFCMLLFVVGCNNKNKGSEQITSKTAEEGVLINGVVWATCNVDAPNTFAESPESAGMFYQWNSKVGWSSSDPIRSSKGDSSWFIAGRMITEWTDENDPSPEGWRLPTIEEIKRLLDTQKVIKEWVTQNGTNGLKFTDKVNGNTIFLPAAGHLNDNGSLYLAGIH